MSKNRRATVAGSMAALSAVFALASAIPGVGALFLFALPLPAIAAGLKAGAGACFLCTLGSLVTIGISQGPAGLLVWLVPAALGLSIGVMAAMQTHVRRHLTWGTVSVLAAFVVQIQLAGALSGVDFSKEWFRFETSAEELYEESLLDPRREQLVELREQRMQILQTEPVLLRELEKVEAGLETAKKDYEAAKVFLAQFREVIMTPWPFVMFMAFLMTAITLRLARSMSQRFELGVIPELGFRAWQCPKTLSLVFVLWILVAPELRQLESGFLSTQLARQLIVGFGYGMQLVYALSGFALIVAFALHHRLSTLGRCFVFGTGIVFMHFLMIAALFDSFFNFRNRWITNSDKGA